MDFSELRKRYYNKYNMIYLPIEDIHKIGDKPKNIDDFIDDLIKQIEGLKRTEKKRTGLINGLLKERQDNYAIKKRLRDKVSSLKRQTSNIGVQFEGWINDWYDTILTRKRKN